MDIARSDIVKATAGRDKDKLFFVLDVDGEFLLLADGKSRKLENPKRKKSRHAAFEASCDYRVAEKIRSGDKITNSELRRALATYAGAGNSDQEG